MFNNLPIAINGLLTVFINSFSGLLQISVYIVIGILFFYALGKCWQAFRALSHFDFPQLGSAALLENCAYPAPLALVAASSFSKTKKHYVLEKRCDLQGHKMMPPDGFIRDAAFQYSERYFEENFLDPIATAANMMPPLGFIGTIIGMVVNFLATNGTLKSQMTVTGIATALYTTLIGLVCYTILELVLKVFSSLARRRIDEGLAAVDDRVSLVPEKRAA